MLRVLFLIVLAALVWRAYQSHHVDSSTRSADLQQFAAADPPATAEDFKCDGRTYCSQMTSCPEATYFLNHCPDVKMDGNHDGVPCERQWCGSH